MIKPPPPQPLSYASTSSTLASLLSSYTCYDVLGVSVKQVIFETGLPVKKALALMLQNRMVCVPLIHAESASSSSTNRYAGILTATDFIRLVLRYYSDDGFSEDYEAMDIGSLLKQLHDNKDIVDSSLVSSSSPFSIHPMDSLFVAAAKLLIKNTHIHRIPLVDEQLGCCILSIMEASRLVKFIAANFPNVVGSSQTPKSLDIGTYSNHVASVTYSSTLISVLKLFIERGISSLPVVDDRGVVLDVIEEFDVLNLAREGGFYDLEMSVRTVLEKRQPESINPVHTCTLNDTLGSLLATIKSQLVFRFVVVETAVVSDVPNNVVANSDPTTTASSTTHSESNNPSSSSLDDEDEEDIQVFVKKRKPLDQQSVTSDTSAIIEGRLLGVISHSDLLSYLIKSSG